MTVPAGRAGRWTVALAVLLAGLAVGWVSWLAFGSGAGDERPAPSQSPTTELTSGASDANDAPGFAGVAGSGRSSPPDPASLPLTGLTVALDPGHNGANAQHPDQAGALVPDGRGGSKACNTVGTSTDAGYAEHAFTWDVASRATTALEDLGARVVVTRADDEGVGPCVDVRGGFAQAVGADVLVSVHANGSDDRAAKGFFVIVADPPPVVDGPPRADDAASSERLATAMVGALASAGFTPSGSVAGAISRRGDLATLNLAARPAVLLELAEMRNPDEAALASSEEGRQRYADAIAAGVVAWAG
ncbi:N-acetylmuramoyl-L-alanine amidase [Oerskovia enterophila]|uniref:N-acetylmuramoyl-l-alanine amidase I n=1 Tax=Oerskovia enterophila TaxID=43678 RepID=A0A163R9W7_9CELL|nr:N-acetylmuramoyl-L-alanine amidase [Oerskovia enterophila]KZM34994.1 N-acetylmuramoyl-l-alanine amidase I [Oerskovia enterophila]